VRAEEIEATIKRLIKSEEGMLAAIQLVDQMVQAGGIDERAEERLPGVIERRGIRFAVENSLDGSAFDSSGMSYEDVIASMEDLVEEFETPKEKEWAQTVTAMLGSDKAAGKIKDGGGVARRSREYFSCTVKSMYSKLWQFRHSRESVSFITFQTLVANFRRLASNSSRVSMLPTK